MEAIFPAMKTDFFKYNNHDNIEVEFRIGKINSTFFDTNVGKDVYEKVLRRLRQFTGWDDVVETNTSVYYKGTKRITVNDDNDDEDPIKIHKRAISKKNFKFDSQYPFDVRMAISTEVPLQVDEDEEGEDEIMDFSRTKSRVSFVRKNLSIDVTQVTGEPDDMDREEETSYEIELEIINPMDVTEERLLYNIVHKIFDVLKIVE